MNCNNAVQSGLSGQYRDAFNRPKVYSKLTIQTQQKSKTPELQEGAVTEKEPLEFAKACAN